MKKKLPLILGAVAVVLALVAMIAFVAGGDYNDEPVMDLSGSWKIVMDCAEGAPAIPADNIVVFDAEQATIYRDGTEFAASSYNLGAVRLELPEMSREYDFTKVSDHLIKLVMTEKNYMYLYRLSGDELEAIDTAQITGKWDVLCHGGTAAYDEYMLFENGMFADYQGSGSEPAAQAAYTWESNVLNVADLGMQMEVVAQTPDRIIMVQLGAGYVWELQKAAE